MAFAQNWVEGDPDGSVITGSLLDDWIRFTKIAVRERMEGDPALNLTGLIEAGSWVAAPMPKQGSARAWAVTAANLGTVPLQDGRMAITTDTHRLYHLATAGFYELDYLSKAAGGVVAGVTTFSGGIIGTLAGNATTATALATPRAINGVNFDGTAAITVPAAAGTLTGATLAAGVTGSSLTSVGVLVNLTVTNPIAGSITGSSASCTGNSATATTAGTVTTAAQPAITSVGTLTGLSINGNLTISGDISMTNLTSRLLPGATAFVIRNNADTANNLNVTDAGVVTIRAGLTVSGGGITLTGSQAISINGNTVVSSRRPGWATQTGTQTRADMGASPSLATVASTLDALIMDMEAHGLI